MKLKYLGLLIVGSRAAHAAIITLSCIIFCLIPDAGAVTSFQSYRSPGNNLIHITTADLWGTGYKRYVVGMTVDNRVLCFGWIPGADPDNIPVMWTNNLGQFGFMLEAASLDNTGKEKILIPCADGHLRILDKDNNLTDWSVSSGALYCVGVGTNSDGDKRIVTGGVDGKIYIYNRAGTLKGTKTLDGEGVVRRVVVGNFDGTGGDEIVVFYKPHGFAGTTDDGSCLDVLELTDTNTLSHPSYWDPDTGFIVDDVASKPLNWYTDKQLPSAYDMDEDGRVDVLAHWGLMIPTNSTANTTCLSGLLRSGDELCKSEDGNIPDGYTQFTATGNQYIMQKSVPGNFRDGPGFQGKELFTLLGDDLYLWGYDNNLTNFPVASREYGYSHSLYHFTDGARLEDDSGIDKMVLCGPNNGDDRFYVVDLSSSQWTNDAKQIHTTGRLKEVEANLDALASNIAGFTRTAAKGDAIRFIDITPGVPSGWDMTSDSEISKHAGQVYAAQTNFYWLVNGDSTKKTSNVVYYAQCQAHMGVEASEYPKVTAAGQKRWCKALAERGVHFSMVIGHGDNFYFDNTSDVADWFEASIFGNECYMMLRIQELQRPDDIDQYKSLFGTLNARAAACGVSPPKILINGKGAYFTTLTTGQAATYLQWGSAYRTNLILGAESSNSRLPEWSMAERVGLWMFGYVPAWSCEAIGDMLAANRVAEWSDIRNGHLVLRRLLSQYVLGATVFRFDGSIYKNNPMYPDVENDSMSNPWRQGTMNFLKIVEKGIYPASPAPGQIKGISPVVVALPSPSPRFDHQSDFHNWDQYAPQPTSYVVNNLECWNAYTKIPSSDATAFLHGTTRRWDNLFPTSDSGFVAVVPFAATNNLLSRAWWKKAYETDANTWSGFSTLTAARTSITNELYNQRANMMFYVDGDCFWQITQEKGNTNKLYALLMDRNALTPMQTGFKLKKGNAVGTWDVYNRFNGTCMGALTNTTDFIWAPIKAGSIQIFELIKR